MTKTEYYIGVAKSIGAGSSCARRKFGAVIVKNNTIVGTGYNGSASGTLNCGTEIPCIKDVAEEPANLSYQYCPAVHAEQNAIINSNPDDRFEATMYLAPVGEGHGDRPCYQCRRRLLNSGIVDIYYVDKDGETQHEFISQYVLMENDWMLEQLDEHKPDWERKMLQ
jgi:dCMP deaminase